MLDGDWSSDVCSSDLVLAPFGYLEIVSATILGFLVFGDFPEAPTWAGIAVIVASGLYIVHRERVTGRSRDLPPLE
jgi:drug/metabolite transporter (DMT)-like permease